MSTSPGHIIKSESKAKHNQLTHSKTTAEELNCNYDLHNSFDKWCGCDGLIAVTSTISINLNTILKQQTRCSDYCAEFSNNNRHVLRSSK